MNCKNCGNELKEGDVFCVKCGTKVEQVVNEEVVAKQEPAAKQEATTKKEPVAKKEPAAKKEPVAVEKPVVNQEPVVMANPGVTPTPVMNQPVKKKKTGLIIGLIVAFIFLIAFIFLLMKFIPMNSKVDNSKIFYVEDNELVMADLTKSDYNPIQLNDEYRDEDMGWTDYGFLYGNIQMSSNGKICYFPSRLDDEYAFDLCAATVKKGEAVVEEIDSDVYQFTLLDDDTMLYIKKGKLYYYDGDEKNKLASDVMDFYVSQDQKSVLWTEDEEYDEDTYEYTADIYWNTIKGNKDEVLIEKNVIYMGSTENFDHIFAIKHDDLYSFELDGDSDKLISDCGYLYPVDLDENIFYYTEEKESDISLMDFLDDPYAKSDAQMEEPRYEDFEVEVYDDFWDYTYTDTDYEAYDEAYYAYQDAYYREIIREELKDYEQTRFTQDLYFFDGKESTLITENFDYFLESPTEDQYICSIKEYKDDLKISIDDLWDASDLYYQIDSNENVEWKTLIVSNGKTEVYDDDEINFVWVDEEMMFFGVYNEVESEEDFEGGNFEDEYFEEDYYEDDYYDFEPTSYTLYSFDLSKSNFGDTEELSDEMNSFEGIMNGKPYYICGEDEETMEGDLYCGTEEIVSDVRTYSVGFMPEEDAILFTRDADEEEWSSTLVAYKDDDEEEIADDVSYFTASKSNYIIFLQDFDYDDMYGELMIYDKGDTETIASDVSMFSIFDEGISGSYYGSW